MTVMSTLVRNKRLTVSALLLSILAASTFILFLALMDQEPRLRVEEAYFEAPVRKGEWIPINVIVVLTNDGKADAGDVRIDILAIETDSNLARGNGTSWNLHLGPRKTQEIRATVEVPRNSTFRIEILIFRAQKLTIWGYGVVDLTGLGQVTEYSTEQNLDEPEEPGVEEDGTAMFCLALPFLAIIGTIVLLIIAVPRMKKRKGDPAKEAARPRIEHEIRPGHNEDEHDAPDERLEDMMRWRRGNE